MFSTEGHIFPLSQNMQIPLEDGASIKYMHQVNYTKMNCDRINDERRFLLPLKNHYFAQLSYKFEKH